MEKKQTKQAGVPPTQTPPTPDFSSTDSSGFENVNREDLGIPFITILQKGSPQVDVDHKDHAVKGIDGASVGDIINTVTNTVIADAGEEIVFTPCSFQKLFMEWKPREQGGGLVKTHNTAAILSECQRNEKGQDVLRSGNIIVTTAYFYGIATIDGENVTCILGLTSTQLKKSKQWLNLATSLKLTKPDGSKYTPPFYSHQYLLSSVPEKNDKGTWRGWKISMGKMNTDPALLASAMEYSKRATMVQKQINAPNPEDDGHTEVI